MTTRTEHLSASTLLRYACATIVTLIAAAGAQLVVRSDFTLAIGALALIGAPVSLYLRLHSMRVAGFSLSKPLWNGFTVLVFFVSAGVWTLASMSDLLSLVMSGQASQSFWLRFGAEGSLALLMQVFLLFAAFRSFALISDKDATLATVPSFSVLLLLIPVHKGIEVVLYFLLWTLAATTLFALDHRSELAAGADGRVRSPTLGQDVPLAARGLATVLAAALVAAFGLSALLTSRSSDDRSATESAITGLASRLAQFALRSSESSQGEGIERQIDFSSGPSLPSRTLLWRVLVRSPRGRLLRPNYFRLFALSRYNGSTWTRTSRSTKQIARAPLSVQTWPPELRFRLGNFVDPSARGSRARFGNGFGGDARAELTRPRFPAESGREAPGFSGDTSRIRTPPDPRLPKLRGFQNQGDSRNGGIQGSRNIPNRRTDVPELPLGFLFKNAWPRQRRHVGRPTRPLIVSVRSHVTNLGFVPLLPGTRALYQRDSVLQELRAGDDGSADLGFVAQGQRTESISDVPMLTDYGLAGTAPTKKVVASPDSPTLSPSERALYLEHPRLSARTQGFGDEVMRRSGPGESSFVRANRLALAIQRGSTYTLRPPTPPSGREATDFFLFDGNRRGYCTHFASALAVLCRSQNIPARVVSGFAAQEYSEDGWALLREANAHAWTEVWIENWGWAPVDATPSADRGDNAPNLLAYWSDWVGFAWNQIEMWSRARLWLVGVAVAALLACIYALRRRARLKTWWSRRRGRLSNTEWSRREIIAAYDLASPRLARLFRARAAFETPDEWLAAADQTALRSPRARTFARREFEALTQHYLRARYAATPPDDSLVAVSRDLAREVRRKKRK